MKTSMLMALTGLICCFGCTRPEDEPTLSSPARGARVAAVTVNITTSGYGAVSDAGASRTRALTNRAAIQKAVDYCTAQSGGGTVLVPAGTFVTGLIKLKSNVTLQLEANARLQGYGDTTETFYPNTKKENIISPAHRQYNVNRALIYAENASNIKIIGANTDADLNSSGSRQSVIDGEGHLAVFNQNGEDPPPGTLIRPKLALFINCDRVTIEDVRMEDSPFWTLHFLGCRNAVIDNLTLTSHDNYNNDGVDVDVVGGSITNSTIDSSDDALCFKSNLKDVPCQNVTVTNCRIGSNTNAIKFGNDAVGGFRNITVQHCVIAKTTENTKKDYGFLTNSGIAEADRLFGQTAVSITSTSGGVVDVITIDDIRIDDNNAVQTPIFIKLGGRREYAGLGNGTNAGNGLSAMSNITVRNLRGRSTSWISSSVTGAEYPGFGKLDVKGVTLQDINVTGPGGAPLSAYSATPPDGENVEPYLRPRMYGETLPGQGLFVRHATGVKLINCRFWTSTVDNRPSLYADDASVSVDQLRGSTPGPDGNKVFIRLNDSRSPTTVQASYCPELAGIFASVSGRLTQGVSVYNKGTADPYNWLPGAGTKLTVIGSDVPAGQVTVKP